MDNSSNICDFLNVKETCMMIEIIPRDLKKGLRLIAETIELDTPRRGSYS